MHTRQVWIADFGSQYTQLIVRKTRELGHSCEVVMPEDLRGRLDRGSGPQALVLSGGPGFADGEDYGRVFDREDLPILGICYGMQLMAATFGGAVASGDGGEYGRTRVHLLEGVRLGACAREFRAWMSHRDCVGAVPEDFRVLMESDNAVVAAMAHHRRPLLGLQFHPEVEHTEGGLGILSYFYGELAQLEEDWQAPCMVSEAREALEEARGHRVLGAFSGGVDSLVSATLAQEVLGEDLLCFFVDHGLLRPQDYDHLEEIRAKTPLPIEIIDARDVFLRRLEGLEDAEEKRKAIGKAFIDVFEEKAHEYEKSHGLRFEYLLQGTLYSDVIESACSRRGGQEKTATIKSHHNVGGLPERMHLKLLEPLRHLFKDEVRLLGEALGLPRDWLGRHPFPGPGIGVRILGAITGDRILKVQRSDQILLEEIRRAQLYEAVAQAFTVLLPVKTVGVKGDGRALEEVICVRMVSTSDYMTATWSRVPHSFLARVSGRITNEVPGITRAVYDITSKPPGTIEWE